MRLSSYKFSILLSLSLLSLASCAEYMEESRDVTARRIGMPAFMVPRVIEGAPYEIPAWERMYTRGAKAHVYIEGADKLRHRMFEKVMDQSPSNPVALHLASRDHAENIVWLGQPCSYEAEADPACDVPYGDEPAVSETQTLESLDKALDEIRARYEVKEFHLIGYDEGGHYAAQLAVMRKDVKSLRTVAGALRESDAPKLAATPQHHFIGAADEMVPPSVYHQFRQAMGASYCVYYSIVPDADHERGWVEKWPELLKQDVNCLPKPVIPPPPVIPKTYNK